MYIHIHTCVCTKYPRYKLAHAFVSTGTCVCIHVPNVNLLQTAVAAADKRYYPSARMYVCVCA